MIKHFKWNISSALSGSNALVAINMEEPVYQLGPTLPGLTLVSVWLQFQIAASATNVLLQRRCQPYNQLERVLKPTKTTQKPGECWTCLLFCSLESYTSLTSWD